jgi:hypothetical protein
MLTLNADHHPLMSRMHKPDPKLPPDQQDKRSVIPIEKGDIDLWLAGTVDEAMKLLKLSPLEVFEAGPTRGPNLVRLGAERLECPLCAPVPSVLMPIYPPSCPLADGLQKLG